MYNNVLGGVLGDIGFIPVAGNLWFPEDVGIGRIPTKRLDVYESSPTTTTILCENDNAGSSAIAELKVMSDGSYGSFAAYSDAYSAFPALAGCIAFGVVDSSDLVLVNLNLGGGAGDVRIINNSIDALIVKNSDASSFIGVHTSAPDTILHVEHASPYVQLQNTADEDTDGGREARIQAKGSQSGGEESTLGYLEFSHDGAADDEKGQFKVMINDGDDGASPSIVGLEIDSTGAMLQKKYAGMFCYDSATTFTVGYDDQYYAINGVFASDFVNGFTFVAGSVGAGNITTAAAGAAININDATHGLVSGDYVNVQSTNHTGTSVVTYVDADNFTLAIAFVGNEACTWNEGDYMLAGAGTAGVYHLAIGSTSSSGAANKTYKFEPVINATHIDKAAYEVTTSSTAKQSGAGTSLWSVVPGDRLWFQFKNSTDTRDLVLEHSNFNLFKIN